MTTTKRAARSLGGIVMAPPIDRNEAGRILGALPSLEAWQAVARAFASYGYRLDDLAASKASRKKDDPQSWHARQSAAARALEIALNKIDAARKHGQFLEEASDNYTLQTFGHNAVADHSAREKLNRAFKETLEALIIVERANPEEIEIPTAATARDLLVREIAVSLVADGIVAAASYGATLDQLERVKLADLTPFERLIAALQIGDEKKPAAFSAFVRAAIAGKIQG